MNGMGTDEQSQNIPLAEIMLAANELIRIGLIHDWALGGALASIYYVEPFTTYDADIFFIPKEKEITAGIPEIYAHLQGEGWRAEKEHLLTNRTTAAASPDRQNLFGKLLNSP